VVGGILLQPPHHTPRRFCVLTTFVLDLKRRIVLAPHTHARARAHTRAQNGKMLVIFMTSFLNKPVGIPILPCPPPPLPPEVPVKAYGTHPTIPSLALRLEPGTCTDGDGGIEG